MVCKLVVLIRKKEGVSDEAFHTYWSKNHAQVFLNGAIVKEKVISYTQYHVNKTDLASFTALPTTTRGDHWDGIVNITVEKVEDLNQIFEDPHYLKAMRELMADVIDSEDSLLMVGHDEDKKLNGQVQPGVF